MNKVFFTILFTTFFFAQCLAQSAFVDSIRYALKKKPTPEVMLDGRNSIINNYKVPIGGIKSGLDFNSILSIGIGYNWLRDGRINTTAVTRDIGKITFQRQTKIRYLSIYAQYVFYKTKHWEFAIMPQIGYGNTFYNFTDSLNTKNNYKSARTKIFIYEPMMSGSYRIFKFGGVGADLGFRLAMSKKTIVKEVLSSPIYSFHIDIYWWTIYKAIFRKNKK